MVVKKGESSLREFMIRFVDDGVMFNEIDEDRNYFLMEAESIIEKIRVRLTNEKRVSSPKEFECWVDGRKIIITSVRFEKSVSLEEQLKETILSSGWEEEIKHKYINKINDYAQKEREMLTHKEYKAFIIRFDQYMGSSKIDPFPLILNLDQLKLLFDGVFVNVSTGFYSELEEIMGSVDEAYRTVVEMVNKELAQIDITEHEGSLEDTLKERITAWLENDEKFNRFKNYVVSRYASVPKSRINALYPKHTSYQHLQKILFTEFTERYGFDEAYEISKEIKDAFFDKYHQVLFEGFAMKNDEVLESIILSPIIKTYSIQVKRKLAEKSVDDEK